MEKVYILRWYNLNNLENGRFLKKTTFNLYLIGGRKKHSKKKIHYDIGKAERKLLSDRLNDRNHHINDFSMDRHSN